LLVSGGSSRAILDHINLSAYNNLTVGQLDERIGAPEIRNWMPVVTFPVLQNVTVEDSGRDYDKKLHKWKHDNPGGKIVVIQGIGADGHTAGMFPGHDVLFNSESWAVGYDAGPAQKFRYRVTVTNTFLKIVDISVLYVVGNGKKDVLKNLEQTPAGILRKMKKVQIFTDIILTKQTEKIH
jgi:6-phosphogluconolactonase/glucosamine-6-phosphate isomerase/deaminase